MPGMAEKAYFQVHGAGDYNNHFRREEESEERRQHIQRQFGAEVFGHVEKKPTAFLSSPEITFTKYNGFRKISANFADGTHGA